MTSSELRGTFFMVMTMRALSHWFRRVGFILTAAAFVHAVLPTTAFAVPEGPSAVPGSSTFERPDGENLAVNASDRSMTGPASGAVGSSESSTSVFLGTPLTGLRHVMGNDTPPWHIFGTKQAEGYTTRLTVYEGDVDVMCYAELGFEWPCAALDAGTQTMVRWNQPPAQPTRIGWWAKLCGHHLTNRLARSRRVLLHTKEVAGFVVWQILDLLSQVHVSARRAVSAPPR